MFLRILRWQGAAAFAALALATTALAAPVNIDTFDLGSAQAAVFDNNTASGFENIADTSQTIGGVRGYLVSGQSSNSGVATLKVAGGRLGLGTLTILPPYYGSLGLFYGPSGYTSTPDLNANLAGTDLTANTGLSIDMAFAEYDYQLRVMLGTNGSTSIVTLNQAANMNPHSVFVPFWLFSGIDPQDIDQVQVFLDGQNNGDYAIDAIRATVPEPASMALLGVAAVAGLWRRRRGA